MTKTTSGTRSDSRADSAPSQASDGATDRPATGAGKKSKGSVELARAERLAKGASRANETPPTKSAPLTETPTAGTPRPATKKQILIDALAAPGGTDLTALTAATGWQTHTVRAALTRLKAEGHVVVREPGANGAPARYRIIAAAPAEPGGTVEMAGRTG